MRARICAVAALALVAAAFGCGGSRAPLSVLGEVPQFQLTAQDGKTFDSKSLDGHVWVANFIYTTCTGPCPMMSSQMHRLQSQTADMRDVKLISFTVDPEHDTPAVLAAYGQNFRADPDRWTFLTGEQVRLSHLGKNVFMLNSVDGSLMHSTRFVLVDRHRRIRGYYVSSEEGFLTKLVHDVRQLERETS